MHLVCMMSLMENPCANVIANMKVMDVHANWHQSVLLARIVLRTHSAWKVYVNAPKVMNVVPPKCKENLHFLN